LQTGTFFCLYSALAYLILIHFVQLFNSRKRKLKSIQASEDALGLLEMLGAEGMSSEESEGELRLPGRRYLIKSLPWRAPDLTAWLHEIDSLPAAYARPYSSRTYQQRTRVPSNLVSKKCRPPIGLPASFYRQEWLATRSEWVVAKLQIMRGQCVLPPLSV
jgi:hypothetical protein